VAAEAFTSEPAYAKWQEHPFALKPLADAAFCEGINRLVFQRFESLEQAGPRGNQFG